MNKILKMLAVTISIFTMFTITACANSSNMEGRPPRFEKISEEDFYAGLNLKSSVKSKLEVILSDFKDTLKTTLKDVQMPPSRDIMEPLIEARDKKVKPLLTDEQYETYKKTVEGLFVPDHDENSKGQRPGM